MTIRAFSIQVLAAIHPPCGGCRIIVGCALAANGLSEQRAQGGGTGGVIQKQFVRGSATSGVTLLLNEALRAGIPAPVVAPPFACVVPPLV
jgi:hypothetical protein